MPTLIENRQTEALEAIAQALQARLHPEALVPTHRARVNHALVSAGQDAESGDWSVTTENPNTGQRKVAVLSAKDFATQYEAITPDGKVVEEPPVPYRNKASQEVVQVQKAHDGNLADNLYVVTHADGRPEERITEQALGESYEQAS